MSPEYNIVIVDNASPGKAGSFLANRYKNSEHIYILLNSVNEGFARGNNIGYKYAKGTLKSDFIIIMNNDVIIRQNDFLHRIESIYHANRYDILGPDICAPDGEHRNPHRVNSLTPKDLRRIIRNRSIILTYLKAKRCFHLEQKIQIIENMDKLKSYAERNSIEKNSIQENVVLQGSCIVFSPDFIQNEDYAFYPETFMYLEEDILTYLCVSKKYIIRYDPSITVTHEEEISTRQNRTPFEKYYFYNMHLKNSAEIFLKLICNVSTNVNANKTDSNKTCSE